MAEEWISGEIWIIEDIHMTYWQNPAGTWNLMKVKEESAKEGLQLNFETKMVTNDYRIMWIMKNSAPFKIFYILTQWSIQMETSAKKSDEGWNMEGN